MLKLSVPTHEADATYLGQVAYGADELPNSGREVVAQKWTAIQSADGNRLLTCINEATYGSDFSTGEMRLTLLRSPSYSAHPIGDLKTVPQDRFSPRIDQGERLFRIWLNGGPATPRRTAIDREALAQNEKPMVLSFFPSGQGKTQVPFAAISGNAVQITAIKKAEDDDDLIVRLFEPTGQPRTTTLTVPMLGVKQRIRLGSFEIKTLRINKETGACSEVNLMETAPK